MGFLQDIRSARAPAGAFVAVGLYWGCFAALAPDLKAGIGASDGAFGLAMLVASVGACLAMMTAPLADRRLGGAALPLLSLAMTAGFLLPGWAPGVVTFALAMSLAAMTTGTLDVVMNARLSQIEADSDRPLMNLLHGLFSFAYAGAALLAGLGRELGLSPATVFALAGLVTLALCLLMREAPRATPATATGSETPAPRLPVLLLAAGGGVILVGFLAEQATEGWSALFLERSLGGGAAQGALGPAILGLTMGIGRLSGQGLARRFDARAVIRTGGVLAAAGATIAATAPSLGVAYLGFGILGLGVSVTVPMAFALVGRAVPDRMRTAAISRVSVIGYAGFFFGPPLMGFLSELWSLRASFLAVAVLLLVMAGPVVGLLRRDQAISVAR